MSSANKFNLILNNSIRVITLIAFFLIGAFSIFARGKFGYSTKFLNFASFGAVLGIVATIAFILLDLSKNKFKGLSEILSLGGIGEDSPFKVLNNPILKLGIVLAFAGLIVFTSVSGFQVWSEPSAYEGVTAFSSTESLSAVDKFGVTKTFFDIAFVPSFIEDMMAYMLNVAIIMFLFLVLGITFFTSKFRFFKPNKAWLLLFMVTASLTSGFYFAQAHEIVGGSNQLFILSAWIFQSINLMVYNVTGLFLPVAHFVHNSIFALGFSVI